MRFGRSSMLGVVGFAVGALVVSGPQIAIAAFDAVNADKVDGRHAVGPAATRPERAGKLVATNSEGFLPGNIIERVSDSNQLDGLDSTAFQKRVHVTCAPGSSMRAVTATGGVACETDDINGGNAQTLDGKNSTDFHPVVNEACPIGEVATSLDVMGIACAADAVDGGNAQTLDGVDSTAFARPGSRAVFVRGDSAGATNGQALRDAIAAITNATAADRYIVYLGPGEYVLGTTTLTIKPYVSVMGSGRGTTLVTSTADVASTQGAIRLSEGVEVSRLTLQHLPASVTPPATAAFGIDAGHEARLVDVEVGVSGPGDVYGVHVGFNSVVDIVGSRIGAGGVTGVDNEGIAVRADNSTAVFIRHSDLGGGSADAEAGTAVEVHDSNATVLVEDSSLRAEAVVARRIGGGNSVVRIANSRIDAPTTGATGVTCFDTYNTLFALVSCTP